MQSSFYDLRLTLYGISDFSDLLLQTKWIDITQLWMEDAILAGAPEDVNMIDIDVNIPQLRAVQNTTSVQIIFDLEIVFHIRGDTDVTVEALIVEPFYTPAARAGYVNRLKASESALTSVNATSPLYGRGLTLPLGFRGNRL